MIAQIYTKTLNNDISSVLICNDKGGVYFSDAMDTPEITVLQRGVSYVKNNLNADKTELYVDELDHNEVMKDAYINYCKVNHCIGENPNPDMIKQCTMKLQQELRWNFTRGGRE